MGILFDGDPISVVRRFLPFAVLGHPRDDVPGIVLLWTIGSQRHDVRVAGGNLPHADPYHMPRRGRGGGEIGRAGGGRLFPHGEIRSGPVPVVRLRVPGGRYRHVLHHPRNVGIGSIGNGSEMAFHTTG